MNGKARREGERAGWLGESRIAPYDARTRDGRAWKDGYKAGESGRLAREVLDRARKSGASGAGSEVSDGD